MKNESGRSMLEMLGVLAIIGVLSAGAMAGYSKAMMQHKLNKNAEEIGYLLATAFLNFDQLNKAGFNLIEELQALGGFMWHIEPYAPVWPGKRYLSVTDSLGNQLWFEHYTKEEYPNVGDWFSMAVYLPQSDYINKVCYNYVNVFKNLSSELYGIYVTNSTNAKDTRDAWRGQTCTSGKCLQNITNTDIVNLCQKHCIGATRCILYAMWGTPAEMIQQRFE